LCYSKLNLKNKKEKISKKIFFFNKIKLKIKLKNDRK
jgi:hypothetical protein